MYSAMPTRVTSYVLQTVHKLRFTQLQVHLHAQFKVGATDSGHSNGSSLLAGRLSLLTVGNSTYSSWICEYPASVRRPQGNAANPNAISAALTQVVDAHTRVRLFHAYNNKHPIIVTASYVSSNQLTPIPYPFESSSHVRKFPFAPTVERT